MAVAGAGAGRPAAGLKIDKFRVFRGLGFRGLGFRVQGFGSHCLDVVHSVRVRGLEFRASELTARPALLVKRSSSSAYLLFAR